VIPEIATRRPFPDAILTERETLQHPQAGTVLFEEGEQPHGIYIVHSGTIDLLFRVRTGDLKNLGAGDSGEILGLGAVVSGGTHDYTARARTACQVGFIDRESFLGMLERSPELWLNVLRLLSRDVNASYESLRTGAVSH
jgi:CRP/FNR family transcriptional regulator, cyclic AMP receptor protein